MSVLFAPKDKIKMTLTSLKMCDVQMPRQHCAHTHTHTHTDSSPEPKRTPQTRLTFAFRRLRVILAALGAHHLFFPNQGVPVVASVLDGLSVLWGVFRAPRVHAIGHLAGFVACSD